MPRNANGMPRNIQQSDQIAENYLKEIIDAAGLDQANVIAGVADHGMAPMHTPGFSKPHTARCRVVERDRHGRGALTSRTNAVTVGGAANVYINLQGESRWVSSL